MLKFYSHTLAFIRVTTTNMNTDNHTLKRKAQYINFMMFVGMAFCLEPCEWLPSILAASDPHHGGTTVPLVLDRCAGLLCSTVFSFWTLLSF